MLKSLQAMQTSSSKVCVKEHEELKNWFVVELDHENKKAEENLD